MWNVKCNSHSEESDNITEEFCLWSASIENSYLFAMLFYFSILDFYGGGCCCGGFGFFFFRFQMTNNILFDCNSSHFCLPILPRSCAIWYGKPKTRDPLSWQAEWLPPLPFHIRVSYTSACKESAWIQNPDFFFRFKLRFSSQQTINSLFCTQCWCW